MSRPVAFNQPRIVGRELEYIERAVGHGNISADGAFTRACSRLLEQRLGIHRVLLVTSGTAALELAAQLCGLEPGDEVILPSFTFVSTASAVVRLGARPVFVDIRPDTLNLDERQIEAALTPRTKAVIPVHYAGVACEMDAITALAKQRGLLVIEDAAHAIGARYKHRALGALGQLGCFSFHETKNVTCGEGGALCINDEQLVARAEILRDKGTNRRAFFRGEVDKYTWVDVGSSYVMSEILSAFLLAQLEQMDALMVRRLEIYAGYRRRLASFERAGWLRLPVVPEGCETNAHNFYVLLPDERDRDALIAHLRLCAISAVFHYVPLHSAPMARELGCGGGPLPVTDRVAASLVRLPFHYGLDEDDLDRVAEAVGDFLHARHHALRPAS